MFITPAESALAAAAIVAAAAITVAKMYSSALGPDRLAVGWPWRGTRLWSPTPARDPAAQPARWPPGQR